MAIDRSKIRPGDLLLFRIVEKSSWLGKAIGFFSVLTGKQGSYKRTYGHVGLVESQYFYLEMTFPKSKRTEIKLDDPEAELWRIENLTPEKAQKAIDWAKGNLGKWYNIRHIITLGFMKGYGCSDFVSNAFIQSGTGIVLSIEGRDDPVVSPNEIADSKQTLCVDTNGHDVVSENMWKE